MLRCSFGGIPRNTCHTWVFASRSMRDNRCWIEAPNQMEQQGRNRSGFCYQRRFFCRKDHSSVPASHLLVMFIENQIACHLICINVSLFPFTTHTSLRHFGTKLQVNLRRQDRIESSPYTLEIEYRTVASDFKRRALAPGFVRSPKHSLVPLELCLFSV